MEGEGLITLQNQRRKSFANHCRIFYRHSLSLGVNVNGENIITSKEVMDVFNSLISSQELQQPITINKTEAGYSELIKCGLNSIDDQSMMVLTQVRNEERRKAHDLGMKQRCQEFHMILDQIHFPCEEDKRDHTNYVKDFVFSYKQNIGIHSVFAGMRDLLEAQIKNNKNHIYWKFNSATITESLDLDNANDSREYFEKVSSMFLSFLVRVEDEEGDNGVNGNVLCWQVEPSLNRRKMRKFLNYLPHKRDLHAKRTGELAQTEILISSDKQSWCLW